MERFKEYNQSFGYNEMERRLLLFWKSNNVFERSLTNRYQAPNYSFCDGPPTVNGLPAIHHVFSRTVKDVICRYKTLCGFYVRRQAGWDTHGLPVEISVEKKLGLKSNSEIASYGIDKFCDEAKALVTSHINDSGQGWGRLTENMGYWCDMDNAYITCDNNYIESVWWSISEIFKKGLIYKDYKIVPQDPKSESVLSTHELALGYKEVKDPSVYVKFKRKDADEYFLAWTTTPWTLISNVFLAVNPSVSYVRVKFRKDKSSEEEILILAEARLSVLQGELVDVLESFNGRALEHVEYEPIYPYMYTYMKTERRCHFVALGDFVSTEDGTGIVHGAPAFGADDYTLSKAYSLPMFQPIARNGYFTGDAPLVEGKFFKDADPIIIDDLKKRNLLFKKETIIHTYPFSWRYDVPVMYYARESWFIRTSSIAKEMAEWNQTINWVPPEIGSGRFGNWLAENKDWALSRNRFWGTPLPIWVRDDFEIGDSLEEKAICIGSIEDLKKGFIDIKGTSVLLADALKKNLVSLDLHKPFTDKIYFVKNGRKFWRTSEVIDVWYDSGAAPFAQFHYPFENKAIFTKLFPVDFISEGVDQTRGWFYTLHAISSLVFGSVAFKNVCSLGLLLDKNGQKMSKSKGNVVDPFYMMNKYGADTVRWYLLSRAPTWQSIRFNENDLAETQRKFFRAYLESYKFFALYANLDSFFNKEPLIPHEKRSEHDRWILSRLHSVIKQVRNEMEAYKIYTTTTILEAFVVDDLSNWYIRRSRRRFWKASLEQDKLSAYQTLYECLITVSKLASPFSPFLPDEIYKNLNGVAQIEPFDSVHLTLMPDANEAIIDSQLEKRVRTAQTISSLVRTMRERASLKVRQPLKKILVVVSSDEERRHIESQKEIVLDEINVKEIFYIESDSNIVSKTLRPNFKSLGPKCGKHMNAVADILKKLSSEQISVFEKRGFIEISVQDKIFTVKPEDAEVIYHDIEGWLVEHDANLKQTVALDTTLTDELIQEGAAREFVSKIQNMRKNEQFNVSDKVKILFKTDSTLLQRVVKTYESYIARETLAESITFTKSECYSDTWKKEEIIEQQCHIKLSKYDEQ